jgi:uncharacterized protein
MPGLAIALPATGLIFAGESRQTSVANIESPCTKVCTVDPVSRLCVGCGRSLAEIERWLFLTDAERAKIIAELPERLAVLTRRGRGASSA